MIKLSKTNEDLEQRTRAPARTIEIGFPWLALPAWVTSRESEPLRPEEIRESRTFDMRERCLGPGRGLGASLVADT